jgi:rod shape-determining protein MreC
VPALEILSMPATEIRHGVERARTTIDLLDEVARLRAENQRLKSWEWRAKMLDQRMRQMQRLLNVVDEPALEFVSGRVIADGRGPFMRSVLINVGRPQGVRSGYAVIGADGLLGRVLSSGDAASRVLLLNDLKSRIPVFVGETRIRALLVGDNSAWPRLEFLPEGADVRTGDDVYTSGHDGLLPRGLRVGAVFGAKGALRVRTSADLSRFEQVSVLFFDASSRLAVKGSDGDETAASAGSDRLPRPVVSATP